MTLQDGTPPRNGKPGATRGRKASDLNEKAGLPNEGIPMRTNLRFYLASLLVVVFWSSLEIAEAVGRCCFRGAAAMLPRPCSSY
jgi:hypothetical protein